MVVDSSVILAIYFGESHAAWGAGKLKEYHGVLCMSTVNLTETLIILKSREPTVCEDLEDRLLSSGIRFVPPDVNQSRTAAAARLRYPLNLGDCFAYALARAEDCPILTLDADFRSVDLPVVMP